VELTLTIVDNPHWPDMSRTLQVLKTTRTNDLSELQQMLRSPPAVETVSLTLCRLLGYRRLKTGGEIWKPSVFREYLGRFDPDRDHASIVTTLTTFVADSDLAPRPIASKSVMASRVSAWFHALYWYSKFAVDNGVL